MPSNKLDMKALIYKKYGQPQTVFKIEEQQKPIPKNTEVLVKVYNTTVNRTDEGIVTARYVVSRLFSGLLRPKKQIPGTDFSGIITAIGDKVTIFKVGNKVFGFNDEGLSSHAEYLILEEKKAIAIIPNNINFKQAVASLEGMHYAINFINKVKFKKQTEILVYGATGAIGSAMVQLLKYYGCYVVAVANTKNIDLIKSLDVDKVIDYQRENFTKETTKFDFVFDTVGKSSFSKSKGSLSKKGIYLSPVLGLSLLFQVIRTSIFGSKKAMFDATGLRPVPELRVLLQELRTYIEAGSLRSIVDRRYRMDQVSEAHAYVDTGRKKGNVVLVTS